MTKLKTWEDLARSLDDDWPPRQPMSLMELVAEARALDWDFANWCYVSGYDASDPDARRNTIAIAAAHRAGARNIQRPVGTAPR
jgi:hypothetical protein